MRISNDRKGIRSASRGVCAVCIGAAGIGLMLARDREGMGLDRGGFGELKGLSAGKALRGNSVLLLPASKSADVC
jgi:hypothetical protein